MKLWSKKKQPAHKSASGAEAGETVVVASHRHRLLKLTVGIIVVAAIAGGVIYYFRYSKTPEVVLPVTPVEAKDRDIALKFAKEGIAENNVEKLRAADKFFEDSKDTSIDAQYAIIKFHEHSDEYQETLNLYQQLEALLQKTPTPQTYLGVTLDKVKSEEEVFKKLQTSKDVHHIQIRTIPPPGSGGTQPKPAATG